MFSKLLLLFLLHQFSYNFCLEEVLYEFDFIADHATTKTYYFAYGSNMVQWRMKQNVENVTLVGPALLKDYRLDFCSFVPYWEGAVATLAWDPGAETWGILWSMREQEARSFASKKDDTSKLYKLHYVKVHTNDGSEYIAFTHMAKKPPKKLPPWMWPPVERLPSRKYLKTIVEAAIINHFPKKYVEHLLRLPHVDKSLGKVVTRRFLSDPYTESKEQKYQFMFNMNF